MSEEKTESGLVQAECMAHDAQQLAQLFGKIAVDNEVPYEVYVLAARVIVRKGEPILAFRTPQVIEDYRAAVAIVASKVGDALAEKGVPFESFEGTNPLAISPVSDSFDWNTSDEMVEGAQRLTNNLLRVVMGAGYAKSVAALGVQVMAHLMERVIKSEEPEVYQRYQVALAKALSDADGSLTAEGIKAASDGSS